MSIRIESPNKRTDPQTFNIGGERTLEWQISLLQIRRQATQNRILGYWGTFELGPPDGGALVKTGGPGFEWLKNNRYHVGRRGTAGNFRDTEQADPAQNAGVKARNDNGEVRFRPRRTWFPKGMQSRNRATKKRGSTAQSGSKLESGIFLRDPRRKGE